MTDILVIYYTRTGHTQAVAKVIAEACSADLEGIRDVKPRTGVLGYLRSAREALRRRAADIQPMEKDLGNYDLVVIGTPVWASSLSSPVRAYADQQRDRFKRMAAFCTEGGMGGEKVLKQIAGLCGVEPSATLVVTEQDIKSGVYRDKAAEFAESLKQ